MSKHACSLGAAEAFGAVAIATATAAAANRDMLQFILIRMVVPLRIRTNEVTRSVGQQIADEAVGSGVLVRSR